MTEPRLNGTATLDELRREHRLLDAKIDHIENGPGLASPQLKELKRRRLELRDRIARLERAAGG
ncbi:YdcH family protein [Immundisolibacter sp.]|uniref:YdcH family protein n=1 Tax=Immundisolibacter sp. TaxID=1934948 RepID=UPI00260E454B|nr:YdcH family protein [Immundisolibacter sp.]MDD3652111.1 YdcH family protein [Immundisolibacter sp.]